MASWLFGWTVVLLALGIFTSCAICCEPDGKVFIDMSGYEPIMSGGMAGLNCDAGWVYE